MWFFWSERNTKLKRRRNKSSPKEERLFCKGFAGSCRGIPISQLLSTYLINWLGNTPALTHPVFLQAGLSKVHNLEASPFAEFADLPTEVHADPELYQIMHWPLSSLDLDNLMAGLSR